MSEQLRRLRELEVELREVNRHFELVARPLARLSELNEAQRQQLADRLRAAQVHWEAVTRQISQVLRTDSADSL